MSSSTRDTDNVVGASDAALLRRIAAGELGALEMVVDRYARSAYALAGRVIGDHAFAADAVLDVFVSLWETPGVDGWNLAAWIPDATHRHAVDTLRRERALQDRRTEAVRDVARLRDLSGALQPGQREVLVLTYLGGYTLREVATLTARPLPTVREELRLAVCGLVALLVRPGDGPRGGSTDADLDAPGEQGGPDGRPGDDDHLTEEALAAGWAVHALEPDRELWFAEHLPSCPRCRESVRRAAAALAGIAAALPPREPVPTDLWPTLAGRIEARRPTARPSTALDAPEETVDPGPALRAPVGDPSDPSSEGGKGAEEGVIGGVASLAGLQRTMMWLGLAVFLGLCVALGVWYVAFRH